MKRWMMAGAALVLALTLGTVGTLAASPWCRGGQRDCVQNGVCDGSYQTFLAIQALEPDFNTGTGPGTEHGAAAGHSGPAGGAGRDLRRDKQRTEQL